MKVEFNVKYGKNVIDIPITERTAPKFPTDGMANLFGKKITIFNDIAAQDNNPRRFDRHIIEKCSVQGGYVQDANGTVQNIVSAKTVITKDTDRYLPPTEYKKLTLDERENRYTVQIGDYVVLAEVDDEITSPRELQTKYGDDCITVTSVTASIYGMAVDNVTITST